MVAVLPQLRGPRTTRMSPGSSMHTESSCLSSCVRLKIEEVPLSIGSLAGTPDWLLIRHSRRPPYNIPCVVKRFPERHQNQNIYIL